MIGSFGDRGTEDVAQGNPSRAARSSCPERLWPVARRKLDALVQAFDLRDLRAMPGNRLEKLEGDRAGWHSIRINEQFRICFRWEPPYAYDVEIEDYH